MGFTTGFTGGITLTLGIAYLSILAHQRNRQAQGDLLRTQAQILHALAQHSADSASSSRLTSPDQLLFPPPPPTRAEQAARRRADFVEAAKDRWNGEIEGAVRWVQQTDWEGVREDAEGVLARAWAQVVGRTGADQAADAVKSRVQQAGQQAMDSATDAREVLGRKAGEAKAAVQRGLAEGVEKGRELAGRVQTKAAAQLVEGKAQATGLAHPGGSDVEKALHQRYEKTNDALSRSVEEVLRERYRPVDQRDNTILRGI